MKISPILFLLLEHIQMLLPLSVLLLSSVRYAMPDGSRIK